MTVIFTGHCHKLHAHLTHTHALSISHVSHAYLTLTHAHNGLLVPRRDEARRKQRRCARPSRPQQVSGASYPLRGAGGAGGPGAHAGINGQMHGIQGCRGSRGAGGPGAGGPGVQGVQGVQGSRGAGGPGHMQASMGKCTGSRGTYRESTRSRVDSRGGVRGFPGVSLKGGSSGSIPGPDSRNGPWKA